MAHFRLPRYGLLLLTFVTIALLATIGLAFSANSADEEIRIYPATPTFSQPFFVAVSGQWANTCVPAFHTLETETGTILVKAKTPGPLVACIPTRTDWSFSVLVPAQPPYSYTARLSVISGITGDTLSTADQDFDVVGGVQSIPALPLVGEPLSLRLAGVSPDGCVPQYVSHGVVTQTVTFEAQIPDLVCGQVPQSWQMEGELGALTPGRYTAEMFVTDQRYAPPRRSRGLDGSFLVAEQLWHIYLPLWGCLGSDPSPQNCPAVPFPESRGAQP